MRYGVDTSTDEVASALATTDLFSSVERDALRQLAKSGRLVRVSAGHILINRGDTAGTFYLVRSGLLEVLNDAGQRVRLLRAGVPFGELALLSDAPRTATVRAVRDSEAWELPAAAFDTLLETDLGFARATVRALVALVFESDAAVHVASPPRVFSVLPLHTGAPTHAVIEAFARQGRIRVCHQNDAREGAWGLLVDEAERGDEDVLLVASDARDEWFGFCAREADRVLAVADSNSSFDRLSLATPLDLVLVGRLSGRGVDRAREGMTLRAHHVAADAYSPEVFDRIVRRVAGRSIGIVLSGGGARGIAHIGVLSALQHAGVIVDRFGGTSMGALVGALAALGLTPDSIRDVLRTELTERKPFADYALPRVSLIRAERARSMLARLFGDRTIGELDRDFFCVSADLVSAETVVHRHGSIATAVGASMSLPGFAPPVRDGDRLLVDGGVLDNLPIDVMLNQREGHVIAVDVLAKGALGTRRNGRLPWLVETLARSSTLASRSSAERQRERATVAIVPELQGIGLLDFKRFDSILDAGVRAATAAIAALPPDVLSRRGA
jgi:NTE family protein